MRLSRFLAALLLSAVLLPRVSAASLPAPVVVPTGEDAAGWKAQPADGVSLELSGEAGARGRALKLDFDFHGGGGYAVAHRVVSLDLPANWTFTFRVRGQCRTNNLEFKLIDTSGDNVWWLNQRDFEFPPDGREVTIKQRQVSFAWGPLGGGIPHHVAAIEFAVTAGEGGTGSVWIEDLRLHAVPPPDTTPHRVLATATSGKATAMLAVDGDRASAWTSDAKDGQPALTLDLGGQRELGGLVIDWAPGRGARDYDVQLSSDGKAWMTGHSVRGGNGGRDYVYLPESEARYVRLSATRVQDPAGIVAVANVDVKPLAWSATLDGFLGAIAKDAPRGDYPRAMLGENIFWTVAGLDNDTAEGLLDEVGRLEAGKGQYSIEPFVRDQGRLVTWNDVTATPSLDEGDLPIPSVEWAWGDMRLTATAIAAGSPGHSAILMRYRLRNLGATTRTDTLFLAVRPFQVNPPTQFLNAPGGAASIHDLGLDGRVVRVDGEHGFESLTTPDAFGAAAFDQGDVIDWLHAGRVPPAVRMPDAFGRASGALAYALEVPAGGEREVSLLLPLHERPTEPVFPGVESTVRIYTDGLARNAQGRWRTRLGAVGISLPDTQLVDALKAQLGWVLVNRSGPAIQPGTRSYARSWIRDGCLTSSALLRLGEFTTVKQFLQWFAPYQFGNGKVPCCVDSRGADPVPEHDSSGEFIFLVAQYLRYTGDVQFADGLWPHVATAVAYLDSLRATRRSPEWRTDANARFFGLLPPSISHEGYSAKPMHSYWDDLFALRGYKDAAWLAARLDRPERAAIEKSRDEFAHDLTASVNATLAAKSIDYMPGCADLGDFDATSTSIAFDPVQAMDVLPRAAVERTYERYWDFFRKRRDGVENWDAFTPYEWRNVGAMVHLGWRDRADSASAWLMGFRRPPGFQHWAEVVWHDERAPHFIGDMPHTWVGTDFVRSQLDRLAYEDESDSSLVIGAGIPERWLADSGVVVRGLHTRWGTVSYTMLRDGRGRVVVDLDASGLRTPPGGVVVDPPLPAGQVLDASVFGQSDSGSIQPAVTSVKLKSLDGENARTRVTWQPHVDRVRTPRRH